MVKKWQIICIQRIIPPRRKMQIPEILQKPGIKILDTSVFCIKKGHGLLADLYDCKSADGFPIERIIEEAEYLRETIRYFDFEDAFSIEEVSREIQEEMIRLNCVKDYHAKKGDKKSIEIRFHKGAGRRVNKWVERTKREHKAEGVNKNSPVKELDALNKILLNLSRKASQRSIIKRLSPDELKFYERVLEYFQSVCKEYDIERDFMKKSLVRANRNPCDFDTDKKLVASAITLCRSKDQKNLEEKIFLITGDSDINRMLQFFYEDETYKYKKGIPRVFSIPELYSDLNIHGEYYPIYYLSHKREIIIKKNETQIIPTS